MLGWETLQGISGSAGTLPCGLCTVLPDSLCLNQVIEAYLNKKKKKQQLQSSSR
jgi:hypothetical protein